MTRTGGAFLVATLAMAPTAHSGVGQAGAQSLREPLAARPAALGEAFAAVDGTTEALGYNPAGLATLAAPEGGALVRGGFAGDTFVSVLGGGPLMGFGVGAALAYATDGTVESRDPTGRTAQVNAQQDLVGMLGVGYRFAVLPVGAGAAIKVFHSQLIEEIGATDIAADLGVQAALPGGVGLGAAVQHLGGSLTYSAEDAASDANVLPLLWRFGAAWELDLARGAPALGMMDSTTAPARREGDLERPATPVPHRLRVFAGAVARTAELVPEWGGGLEFSYADRLSLRAGYRLLAGGGAARHEIWSLGLGARLGRFRFDYAAELLPFTLLHRASVTVLGNRTEPGDS